MYASVVDNKQFTSLREYLTYKNAYVPSLKRKEEKEEIEKKKFAN